MAQTDKITRRWEKQQDNSGKDNAILKAWIDKVIKR